MSPNPPVVAGNGTGHVHLKVADLDRALGFYCDVLGFELQQRLGSGAAFISAGGYHHHIRPNHWEGQGGPSPRVPLRRPSDHGGGEGLYLPDPDGNGVELYWDKPQDAWPRTADGKLA